MERKGARTRFGRGLLILAAVLAACGGSQDEPAAQAEPTAAQEFDFTGTVQRVDSVARTVAVLNDDVPGWMSPMSMSYVLDDPDVVGTLEPGDRITAKVRAGDFRTLYGVGVAPE